MPPDPSVFHQAPASEQSDAGQSGSDQDRPAWIVLAHILRPQGRKGEVLAELHTDFPEQFESVQTEADEFGSRKRVFLAKRNFAGTADQAHSIKVASYWLPVGKNVGRIILHFEGIASIEAAEALAGFDVLIPAVERAELDADASYVGDLIGCTLFDRGGDNLAVEVGTVTGVQFATARDGNRRLEEAAPLLAVETSEGEEVLVPYVKAFLISLDTAAKRIEMCLPPGLLDINRSA